MSGNVRMKNRRLWVWAVVGSSLTVCSWELAGFRLPTAGQMTSMFENDTGFYVCLKILDALDIFWFLNFGSLQHLRLCKLHFGNMGFGNFESGIYKLENEHR